MALATMMIRWAMPPVFMISPARRKKGMAMSGKLSMPRKMLWTTRPGDQEPMNQARTSAVTNRAKAMGNPRMMKPKREERKRGIMTAPPSRVRMSPVVLIRVWTNIKAALTGPTM